MKNRFDLVIFDWDGTLVDSIGWIVESLNFAASDCGLPLPPPALARSVIGLSLDRAMATLFPHVEKAEIQPLLVAYQRYYNRRTLGPEALFAGVPELLDGLRGAGYKLAVATGKSRSGLDHAIASTNASRWFHTTRAAGETASKPDPLMLHQIMDELGVKPARTLMVGDSIHDLEMAKHADIEAVGVFCGANEREEIMALQPLLGLAQTAQLAEFLL